MGPKQGRLRWAERDLPKSNETMAGCDLEIDKNTITISATLEALEIYLSRHVRWCIDA